MTSKVLVVFQPHQDMSHREKILRKEGKDRAKAVWSLD